MTKNLVVVESPAKARTIKKYLGKDYEVLASYGHVRDLLPKEGAVEPDNDFAMHYVPVERNEKHIANLSRAMKKSAALYLATDPDREGEAIAWHVVEVLRDRKLLEGKDIHRIVFHEITRGAVNEAVGQSRDISMELVNAQQARRALDYLVGFNLSPLLWRKIRRGLSAGRVQSPALRMIVEREEEIEAFKPREYWTIEAAVAHPAREFSARLSRYGGAKVEQFTFTDEGGARRVEADLYAKAQGKLLVAKVEKKQRRRNPPAPFTTSTLQQEAARKLGFTANRTMRVAQQLYEGIDTGAGAVGLITYMRTDSVTLAQEAIAELRGYIQQHFGRDNLPPSPRTYKTRAKNAQEAHEAVRPTSAERAPASVKRALNEEQFRLYELIWRRTVACQMIHATIDTVAVDLKCGATGEHDEQLRANGSTVANPGFMVVYEESSDDKSAAESERRLPPMAQGDVLELKEFCSEQHFTEPPPRYSEASLIRTLEDFGIGRPSTYAAIISTLQNREYVELDRRRFTPTDVGRGVNTFLTEHFSDYVDYEFTARLEDSLDAVSRGEREWIPLMSEFWGTFHRRVEEKNETVTRREANRPRVLGSDPKTGREVSVRMGRYGPYVQIGNPDEEEEKPKFAGLRPGLSIATISLEEALPLFALPRQLGETPDGEPVSTNIGRFGPYVRFGNKFASLGKEDDPYTVTLERALELIEAKKLADAQREIKLFEGTAVKVLNGRYGPYITDGSRNARIPEDREPASLELEECQALLEAAPPRGRRGKKKAKAASVEPVTKKKVKKKTKKKAKKKKKKAASRKKAG